MLVEDKKQYARAEVKRRLTDSPQRQAPRCPHFGVCGGCQQQHASVPLQQQSKRAALGRLMKREVDDVIAGAPWGYRRRARLSLNYQPKTQQLQMGFRQANAKAIVDVVQCPVLVPQLEALLPAVRECLSALSALRHLGHVELVQADNGPLMVLRHTATLPATDREKLERFSKSVPVFPCLSPAGLRYGAAPSADRCPPAPARRGRDGVMRSARLSTRARRAAMPQVGAPKQGTAPHRRSLWRWPGENPSAIVGSSADNSSSSVRDGGSPTARRR